MLESFKKNFGKRVILYIIGLFVVAVGIRLSLIAGLGTSPSTAFAWAMSKTAGQEVSLWVFCVNALCVVVQIVLLRKKFNPIQLIQLLVSFLFSIFLAYVHPLVGWWVPANYFVRLVQLLISIALQALGIFFVVKAKLITMPIESMLLVILGKVKKGKLGTYKIMFDLFWLIMALLLSAVYLLTRDEFSIGAFTTVAGIREGTFIATLCVGLCINLYDRLIGKKFAKLTDSEGASASK